MSDYEVLVTAARKRVAELRSLSLEHAGDEVQLSVRLPAELRAGVAQVAARRGQSVAAFVKELFERAVREEADPFVGLAADLAVNSRALLAEAVASGAYAQSAADVDEAEEESTTP